MSKRDNWLGTGIPLIYRALVLLAYAVLWAPIVACWSVGLTEPEQVHCAATFLLVLVAGAYGTYRVWAYHPATHASYCEWLKRTPWTSSDCLPLGPVHITRRDIGFLTLLQALVLFHTARVGAAPVRTMPYGVDEYREVVVWLPLLTFLVAQLASTVVICVRTEVYDIAGGLLFGLGSIVYALFRMPVAFVLAVACYGLATIGLRRSLHVVWLRMVTDGDGARTNSSPGMHEALGWPYRGVGPTSANETVGAPITWPNADFPWQAAAPIVAGLVGWWLHVILTCIARGEPSFAASWQERPDMTLFVAVGIAVVIALLRYIIYCSAYRPSIDFIGRIVTGRWLIRRYDHVFIAPIAIVATGHATVAVQWATGITPRVVIPFGVGLMVWLGLTLKPRLRAWQLTGHHRLLPRGFNPPWNASRAREN